MCDNINMKSVSPHSKMGEYAAQKEEWEITSS